MSADTRRIAVKTEAAMFAALAGIVAMMVFMAIGGSGFFTAGFRGLLAGLVVFVALLALLPPPDTAPAETPAEVSADPEADAVEPAAAEPVVPTGSASGVAPELAVVPSEPPAAAAEAAEPAAPVMTEAVAMVAGPAAPAVPEAAVLAPEAPVAVSDAAAEPASVAPAQAARPAALAGPRSAADDLKRIKGVGPKLEAALNAAGFWHFDQIAGWTAAELAWVDESVPGVRGRASRDDWVGQAKRLAAEAAAVAG